jgi:tetratricopeptide (TPR) repeat protein
MNAMSEPIARAASTPGTNASVEVPSLAATPGTPSPTPGSGTPLEGPAGYAVLGEIGQGGMGVVYHARDCSLDRAVALKLLQQRYAHDASASRRFLYEAQITGQLQHPGIPPVHQVGTLPDGRPFLAMKLIQGRTLAALLREQGTGAARWLAVFEAVCQAVGYAHGQGVIHRDLKPGNIMVGAFGEVQVMDWGLAKALARRERFSPAPDTTDPHATRPHPSDRPPSDLTGAGSVLGTPAYMAPEQAIGAVDRLDRRSDVFGLGALLCALLTGKPPFVAADAESTRQLAARAKLDDAFARLDGCGAEPELIALAKRCLSAEPDDRPADAGVLAATVARLRVQAEERARQAEMERARAVVQAAEQHKRRRHLLAAFGVVVVVLLAGVLGTTLGLLRAQQARRDEAEQRREAEKARDLARQRYQLALVAFRGMFDSMDAMPQRGQTKQALESCQKCLEVSQRLAQLDPSNAEAQRDLSISFDRVGNVTLQLGQTKEALEHYQKGLEVRQRRAQADPNNTQAQRDLSVSFKKLGDVSLQRGQTKQALDFYHKDLEVRQRLPQAAPRDAQAQRDLSICFDRLGNVTLQLGQMKQALEHYHNCLEVRQRLAKADPGNAQAQRDLSVSFEKLGDVTLERGQTKQALEYYQKCLEVRQRLAHADPGQAQTDLFVICRKLGSAHKSQHDYGKAGAWFARGRDVLLPWHDKKFLVGKFQNAVPHMDRELVVCQNAEKAIASLDFVLAQKPEQIAALLDVRVRALLKHNQVADATTTAERWADWADKQEKDRDNHEYNAACALALCAAGDTKQKDALTAKAVAVLARLRERGYFKEAARLVHFERGADFASVRDQPAFAAFAHTLKAK